MSICSVTVAEQLKCDSVSTAAILKWLNFFSVTFTEELQC